MIRETKSPIHCYVMGLMKTFPNPHWMFKNCHHQYHNNDTWVDDIKTDRQCQLFRCYCDSRHYHNSWVTISCNKSLRFVLSIHKINSPRKITQGTGKYWMISPSDAGSETGDCRSHGQCPRSRSQCPVSRHGYWWHDWPLAHSHLHPHIALCTWVNMCL